MIMYCFLEALVKKSPSRRRLVDGRSVSFSIDSNSDIQSSISKDIEDKCVCSCTNLNRLTSFSQMSNENINASNISLSTPGKAKLPLTFNQLNQEDKFLKEVASRVPVPINTTSSGNTTEYQDTPSW